MNSLTVYDIFTYFDLPALEKAQREMASTLALLQLVDDPHWDRIREAHAILKEQISIRTHQAKGIPFGKGE